MAKEKVYIRKPKKGLAYFAGNVVEMSKKQAKELYEDGTARPASEVLPKDVPGREKLLARGIETVDELEERTHFQGLGLSRREEDALVEYVGGSDLPEDMPGADAFAKAGITTVEEVENLEDPTEVNGIGDATAEDLVAWFKDRD